MESLFEAILREPTSAHYLAARRLAATRAGVECESLLIDAARRCHAGRFAEAREILDRLLEPMCLSPRVHYLAAWSAEQLGDLEDAELERFCHAACLEGLLATGDGTPTRPFRVTYRADIDDVLRAQGLAPTRRRLLERGGLAHDQVVCDDGSEVWFDVSALVGSAPPRPVSGGRAARVRSIT